MRHSQCRAFWFFGFEIEGDYDLEASTLLRSGKSSTNVTSEASLEDAQASERLYQLAETISTSKTIPGT